METLAVRVTLTVSVMGPVLRLRQAQVSGSVCASKVVTLAWVNLACLMLIERMTVTNAKVARCVISITIVSAVFASLLVHQTALMEACAVQGRRRV